MFLINGQNIEELGFFFVKGALDELHKSASYKDRFEYDWKGEDGVEFDETEKLKKQPLPYALPIFIPNGADLPTIIAMFEGFASAGFDLAHNGKSWRLNYTGYTGLKTFSAGQKTLIINVLNNWVKPRVTPNAPTAMVFDAGNRTIDFTFNPEYTDLYDYEYTLDGGATWSVLTVKPIELSAAAYPAYSIGVRIAETVDDNASPTLWHSSAIAGDFMAAFIGALSVGGYTYDDDLLREKYGELPLSMDEGLSLFPYAYKNGAVALMNNADGSVVDAAFTRAGAGWAMQDGDIAELSVGVPRWDEFYYDDEVGYLVEKAATTRLSYSNLPDISATNVTYANMRDSYSLSAPATLSDGIVSGSHHAQFNGGTDWDNPVFSFFVKIDNPDIGLFINHWSNNPNIRINPHTYTVETITRGVYAVALPYTDGWCYVEYKTDRVGTEYPRLGFYHIPSGATSYQGDNNVMTVQGYFARNGDEGEEIDPKSFIYANGANVTRPAESLQIPLSATTDIWLKYADNDGDIIEQVIEDVPSGNFNVHDTITNGKLLALIAPMRKFTSQERSVLDV